MTNPYAIIAAGVLAIGLWFGGDYVGHQHGIDEQKVADQAEFDRINAEREQQKAEANTKYRAQQDDNLALMVERDQLKTTLEKERENNRKATDDLHARYAGVGLRFNVAQGAALGRGGGCAQGAPADAAGAAGAAVVQLPDQVAENLRQFAYDADQLSDDYRECYGWAGRVK